MSKRESKTVEMPEWFAFMRRMVRATSRRVGDRDIAALGGLALLRDEVNVAIVAAVADLQAHGYSWADIGRELGITRQAAQQKYGRKVAELSA